jgi:PPM family protein phosphatase
MNFWQRLFGKKPSPSPDRVQTAPLDPGILTRAPTTQAARRILIGAAQSTGMERNHNEDSLFYLSGSSEGQERLPEFGMFVVADGMGGHRAGEVASSISVRTVARKLTSDTILRLFDMDPSEDAPSLQELVREALEAANATVVDRVPGGGTTLTAAVWLGGQVTIGHVGDSRAYFVSKEGTRVITRDHSLVQRLVELEQLTEEEAALHPQRNVLWNAIGQGANLKVDVASHPVPQGGYMLLCSDGLWGVISDSEIQRTVLSASDPQSACDQLVQAANAAGGPDNITVILVYFPVE